MKEAIASEPFIENEIYSAKEVAYALGMSGEWVRRRFQREPGVLVVPSANSGRRLYRSLRIPGWVANRVFTSIQNRSESR